MAAKRVVWGAIYPPVHGVRVNKIVGRAHTRANLILRCFTRRDPVLLMSAFNVYVRPILEYCSNIWNLHLLKDIETAEKSSAPIH